MLTLAIHHVLFWLDNALRMHIVLKGKYELRHPVRSHIYIHVQNPPWHAIMPYSQSVIARFQSSDSKRHVYEVWALAEACHEQS